MSGPSRSYPRKGEYGDITPRCQWCGKPISKTNWYEKRYCSMACAGADNYDRSLCGGFSCTIIGVLLSGFLIIYSLQSTIVYYNMEIVSNLALVAILCFILGPYLICSAMQGKELREITEEQAKYYRRTSDSKKEEPEDIDFYQWDN